MMENLPLEHLSVFFWPSKPELERMQRLGRRGSDGHHQTFFLQPVSHSSEKKEHNKQRGFLNSFTGSSSEELGKPRTQFCLLFWELGTAEMQKSEPKRSTTVPVNEFRLATKERRESFPREPAREASKEAPVV